MAVEAAGNEQLVRVVVLLAAGVVAVPLFQAPRARLGARLPGRRAGDRAVRPGADRRRADDPARGGARCRDVPVRDRAGDAAQAPVEPAPRDLRPGPGAGAGVRRAAHRRRHARGAVCRRGLRGRDGLRDDLHRHGHADPRRARRNGHLARPARGLHPAARGPGDRAAAGHRGLPRGRRRPTSTVPSGGRCCWRWWRWAASRSRGAGC